jgi:hypothetical protein
VNDQTLDFLRQSIFGEAVNHHNGNESLIDLERQEDGSKFSNIDNLIDLKFEELKGEEQTMESLNHGF